MIPRMARTPALSTVLRYASELRPSDGVAWCDTEFATSADPWLLSLRCFAESLAQDFRASAASAALALSLARDDESVAFARIASAWAMSGGFTHYRDNELRTAVDYLPLLRGVDRDRRVFAGYLLAEAALACGQLNVAAEVVALVEEESDDFLLGDDGSQHPYLPMMRVMRARLAGFQGRVTEALAIVESIRTVQGSAGELLVLATSCLLRGNNAQRQSVRQLADRLQRELGEPDDYISAGCYILVSYGLIAMSEIPRAAEFVLRAGGDADLAGLNVVDRALGLEMLSVAALAEGDLDAAQAWRLRAEPLLVNPISAPTIERIYSRVALAEGDAAAAAEWAQSAVRHARSQGRAIEAAEGEIVLSRARVALSERGLASAGLEQMAAHAADSGHLAAQKSAARELRAIGRRLRPVPGSGWNGLSDRERDVAMLIAEGFGNQAIAMELHLSEHTVQAHVSRVLAAFGAASRLMVAAQLTGLLPTDPDAEPPAELTPRQRMVAAQIANGRTNDAIAIELGVSVKTVEKHVTEILRRWKVASRIGIARLAIALADGN